MQQRQWGQAGLIAVLLLGSILFVLQPGSVAACGYAQSTILFTPQLTPVELTATFQPDSPLQLNMTPGSPVPQISPIPHPPIPTIEPLHENKGGTEDFGYERVKGSDPPKWMLYWGDEVFFFSPTDPAYASLLDEYRDKVDEYTKEMNNITNETTDIKHAKAGLKFEALGFASGTITAIVSCSTIVGTFWAAGGTAWTCAGGVSGAIGSLGAGIISYQQLSESKKQLDEANNAATSAAENAQQIFSQLQIYIQNVESEGP